jgi:hypothetical protein
MVTWGLVSGSFAFINGPVSFFTLRFLLGLAEAGFFGRHFGRQRQPPDRRLVQRCHRQL